ncbi:MAG TPA: DUF494 domain-containing protein [Gammaproteobacteria bacterium]|nr:DUF494 domain-containing protein [Gammaproteobacteria bacterium]
MKESVLDVLMYLFENYIYDDVEIGPDEEALRTELSAAGFRNVEIDKALGWLEGLANLQENLSAAPLCSHSIRLYTEAECEKLDREARGFLLFLEQVAVLDQVSREMVIDRIMALEADEIDLDQLKWVVLMVLFNMPGQEAAFAWMEDMVFNDMPVSLH